MKRHNKGFYGIIDRKVNGRTLRTHIRSHSNIMLALKLRLNEDLSISTKSALRPGKGNALQLLRPSDSWFVLEPTFLHLAEVVNYTK
jgi:hypothetical protein